MILNDFEQHLNERGDHYFFERISLESAARLLEWKLSTGQNYEQELSDLRAALNGLVLFSEKSKPAKAPVLSMYTTGKFGPAFQARMEVVQ